MRGKPIEVRMAMLSSGGKLPSEVAPMVLSLVEGPGSIMEGRVRGSAKSVKQTKSAKSLHTFRDESRAKVKHGPPDNIADEYIQEKHCMN